MEQAFRETRLANFAPNRQSTMITRHSSSWQVELSKGFRNRSAMLAALGLEPDSVPMPPSARQSAGKGYAKTNASPFPLLAPRGYVARMRKGDPQDPLLRQILPIAEEDMISPGYGKDPLGECHASRAPGILQKYAGRVLLMPTSACAIHCRYCFRRHFPHGNKDDAPGIEGQNKPALSARNLDAALAHIRQDATISEIILSGGDPLCLSDARLAPLAREIASIPHARRLRIHTRMPIVLPERVNEALLAWLSEIDPQRIMVLHANHPNEIDDKVEKALTRLRMAGITLLNQSVLLRGVNDHEDTLVALSERLFAAGVLPYYLHLLDPVQGAAHFAVTQQRAGEIMAGLRSRLSGYLVPRPVREVAGAEYKIPV
uniref:L-lysine 2,3-aminomutase n=1 Tax=Candidatus Kentrum sp. LPFa TaxID=2126335 RepID=A0A450VY91_9GAMM|nr:MAG: L-lysine 2,3-aminomutase [Candidatus Kentron sp. LPFa]VFK34367.1 MAG: L-lysine 2,3-aminomutase [Candidatus Kentron sp. LPFa]